MANWIIRQNLVPGLSRRSGAAGCPLKRCFCALVSMSLGSLMLKGLLAGWNLMAKNFQFHFGQGPLPVSLRTKQLVLLFARNAQSSDQELIDLRRFLANRRIQVIANLQKPDHPGS